jgi:nitrite reductase/ring-hydroxylating ferredoxin subunit/uncharacterized membrane protein
MPLGNDLVVNDVIDRQEWLTPVAETVAGAVDAAYKAAGPVGKEVEDALNGVWLGHPLHAAIVTVPIGAWTTAAVLDVMEANGRPELGPGADAAVGLGLIGAAAAAITGLTQWYPIEEETPRKVGISHAMINSTATLLFLGSYAARKAGNRGTGRALGWLGFGLSMAGAYLGGSLSYSEHLGSDHAPREGLPNEFTPVLDAVELPENRPTKAMAGDIPVMLVKRGPHIHCLADRCAHRGGPLSEGELQGDCIQCPWHGSRFRLEDGSVENGPSTYGQPCFDTRVREGRIEVRAHPELPQNHR